LTGCICVNRYEDTECEVDKVHPAWVSSPPTGDGMKKRGHGRKDIIQASLGFGLGFVFIRNDELVFIVEEENDALPLLIWS
jgi:hypothetical protein